MRRPLAFTLLELLVVMAIIALLLSVLLPSLALARELAKGSLCTNQLHQHALGFAGFEQDHGRLPWGYDNLYEEWVPPPVLYRRNARIEPAGWFWFDYTYPYVVGSAQEMEAVLYCPGRNLDLSESWDTDSPVWGSYGVNESVCPLPWYCWRFGCREKCLVKRPGPAPRQPGETILLMDSGYTRINWWYACSAPQEGIWDDYIEDQNYVPGLQSVNEVIAYRLRPSQLRDALEGRHPGLKVNIAFADYHVEATEAEDLAVTYQEGRYQNLSPLWTPASKTR